MNHFQRNSPQHHQRADLQRGYGGAGQPDYSLDEPNPYASPYGDEDDSWRENFVQRDSDNYRRGLQRGASDYDRSDYRRDTQGYSPQQHWQQSANRQQSADWQPESNWRNAPDEWDRYAREQRGSAYEFYGSRRGRGRQDYRAANRAPMSSGPWTQERGDISNFPDFNPPDSQYMYPGASRAWEGQSYRGYPYSAQDFERAWQHHPSHDQNEYAQRYELGQESGGYGLSRRGMRDNERHYDMGDRQYQRGFSGRGPKGYERSDERVREDICERLGRDPYIDASEVSVAVKSGVVTLEGSVDDRAQKHRAEDIADACSGVKDVQNRINVSHRDMWDLSQSQSANESQGRQQRDGGTGSSAVSGDDKTALTQQHNITRQ